MKNVIKRRLIFILTYNKQSKTAPKKNVRHLKNILFELNQTIPITHLNIIPYPIRDERYVTFYLLTVINVI